MSKLTRQPKAIAIAALIVAATAISGCGSDDSEGAPLPRSATEELQRQLDSIDGRVANGSSGACDDIFEPASAGGNIEVIDDTMASLPSDVDPDVRAALEESFDRLKQLVDDECAQIAPDEVTEPSTDEPVDTETNIDTAPTNTETVQTDTTPTTPTPPTTPTTPTTPQPPADGGGSDGGQEPAPPRGGAEAPNPDGSD